MLFASRLVSIGQSIFCSDWLKYVRRLGHTDEMVFMQREITSMYDNFIHGAHRNQRGMRHTWFCENNSLQRSDISLSCT